MSGINAPNNPKWNPADNTLPTTAELLFAAKEEIHIFERPSRKNINLLIERLEIAEALIKEIGEIKSRTFKSLNSVPVGLPENELWVKESDLQAKLREHGYG